MKPIRLLCVLAVAAVAMLPSGVWSTIVKYMSFDEQVAKSDYVVRGTVTSKSNATIKEGNNEYFVSIYELQVTRTFVGADQPATLKLMNPGGGWKTPELYLPIPDGFIDYEVGSDLVFVLEPNMAGTHVPIALHQSIYRVEEKKNEETRFVRLAGGAMVVNEKGQPHQPLFEQTEFTATEFDAVLKESAGKAGKKFHAAEQQPAEDEK